jgi:hypothetical protein
MTPARITPAIPGDVLDNEPDVQELEKDRAL